MANERKITAIVVEVSGDTLMVTPEELEAGKTMFKAVVAGLVLPGPLAQNVKSSVMAGKLYWPLREGGSNEFQGALLFTPGGEKFFLSPEVFLRAKERYERFGTGGRANESGGK